MARDHDDSLSLDTLFAQADGAIDLMTGGVVPPLQPATTFARDGNNQLLSPEYSYGRDDNNLVRLAERILAKAEHAGDGLLMPSGMAAAAAVLRTVPNGGRLILQTGIYWGVSKFAREFCQRRSIDLIEVDCSDLQALEAAARPAHIIWVETPSNPFLKVVDIAGCAAVAKSMGAMLVVDSTAATPVLSQPLDLGADVVMHSATKSINGHSDVLAGFLACADPDSPVWQEMRAQRHDAGAILGAFEAWLLIRGMRTLPLRVRQASTSALAIANHLHNHSRVEQVLYPGLPSDPGHVLASGQMRNGFGSLLSVLIAGDRSDTLRVIGRLNRFVRATSLGGVESLVEHRATIESTVPDNLLRLSVGIEASVDLIADLNQALDG